MSPIVHAVVTTAILVCGTLASAQMQRPDLEKLGVESVNDLVARHFRKVEEQFDERMQSALPVDRLSAVWDALIEKAGSFERVLGTHLEEQAGMSVVLVTGTNGGTSTYHLNYVHVGTHFYLTKTNAATFVTLRKVDGRIDVVTVR